MNFYKLVQALQDLIFEVASWLVFIPVTLLAILVRPDRIRASIQAEFARKPGQRFDSRLSPPLMWVIAGVLPVFAAIEHLRAFGAEQAFLDSYILPSWSIEAKIFTLAMTLLSGPIAFSAATRLLGRQPMTRVGLEREFYAQCYIFAPVQLFLSVSMLLLLVVVAEVIGQAVAGAVSGGAGGSSDSLFGAEAAMYIFFYTGSIWFLVAQWFFFRHAFKGVRVRRGTVIASGIILSSALWVAIASILLLGSQFVVALLKATGNV